MTPSVAKHGFRISRPCYDKYWRCPGWAGGGTRHAKRGRCDSGSLSRVITFDAWWRWRAHQCPTCGVIVLPYMVRWLDWRFWGWKLRDAKDWLREHAS